MRHAGGVRHRLTCYEGAPSPAPGLVELPSAREVALRPPHHPPAPCGPRCCDRRWPDRRSIEGPRRVATPMSPWTATMARKWRGPRP